MRNGHLAILVIGVVFLAVGGRQQWSPVTQAAAQPATGSTFTFRLTPGPNPGGCQRLDPAMSRPHTVTVAGATAIIKSSGGIDDVAKQTGPGVYATNFSLANVRLDVVADLSKELKTLVVSDKNAGCRWRGETR